MIIVIVGGCAALCCGWAYGVRVARFTERLASSFCTVGSDGKSPYSSHLLHASLADAARSSARLSLKDSPPALRHPLFDPATRDPQRTLRPRPLLTSVLAASSVRLYNSRKPYILVNLVGKLKWHGHRRVVTQSNCGVDMNVLCASGQRCCAMSIMV